mgnify:CR=1 FL=1
MGHRTTRDEKTAPRRVHATDAEWQSIRTSAIRVGRSVSAHVVASALNRVRDRPDKDIAAAIRLLTACYEALSEIADGPGILGSDLVAFDVLLALREIENQLGQVVERLDRRTGRPKVRP